VIKDVDNRAAAVILRKQHDAFALAPQGECCGPPSRWWPSCGQVQLSGPLDGAPLQGLAEALLIGFLVPILIWFNPCFSAARSPRIAIAAILLVKIAPPLTLQQEGWCIAFEPPYRWCARAPASRTRGISRRLAR
jgi:hypothetical protein